MNARERFLAVMNFEEVDRTLLWEFGYWGETLDRWYSEGLKTDHTDEEMQKIKESAGVQGEGLMWDETQGLRDVDVHREFGLDEGILRVPLNSYIYPLYKKEVFEENGNDITFRDPRGHIVQGKKDNSSITHTVKSLIETREDWEKIKAERLSPKIEGRLPSNWDEIKKKLKDRKAPLCLGGIGPMAGLFHTSRYLLGVEKLLFSFSDEPDLIKEIMDYLSDFRVALFDKVLSEIDVDLAYWTEDIAYNVSPFISPEMFRKFMLPGYKKLVGVLHDHGVRNIVVDSDGNNWKLINEFMNAGVTGLGPMEVAAGMNVREIRKAFPKLQIFGGIDKRALIEGRGAIDRELKEKVAPIIRSGGFIPHVDHQVPPDVSLENFRYYRERLKDIVSR